MKKTILLIISVFAIVSIFVLLLGSLQKNQIDANRKRLIEEGFTIVDASYSPDELTKFIKLGKMSSFIDIAKEKNVTVIYRGFVISALIEKAFWFIVSDGLATTLYCIGVSWK